jgi:hypothetical protein
MDITDISKCNRDEWTGEISLFQITDEIQLQFINVSAHTSSGGENTGFGVIQKYWEEEACGQILTTFYIDGVGKLERNCSYDDSIDFDDEFEFHYCTVIYYPLEDKMIAIKHKGELK